VIDDDPFAPVLERTGLSVLLPRVPTLWAILPQPGRSIDRDEMMWCIQILEWTAHENKRRLLGGRCSGYARRVLLLCLKSTSIRFKHRN